MRPVVLSVIDGKNFILGTFDTTTFQSWWKSKPFPGAIDIIQKPIHVYGQYHVCVVKMLDGTYSIYRTKDMGKTWESVYNTVDIIYTLTAIDYGWLIGSTSTGWIESRLDSGYTWTEISSFAPGCRTVINVSDDVLFAHDTNYVWRSEDYARTWSKVLDCHNIVTYLGESLSHITTKYTGYAPPALAGFQSRIVAGCGPHVVFSDDLGINWSFTYELSTGAFAHWTIYNTIRVLQIIVTDVRGQGPEDSSMLFRIHSVDQNAVHYLHSAYGGEKWFSEIMVLPYKGDDNGSITAYDVLRAGSPTKDIFATFSTYDVNNSPIIHYSVDGGLTWTISDNSNVTVYEGDPSQEIVSGIGQQVFDEEYWTTYTWVGAPCHNAGKYLVEYNKTIRNISNDIDLLTTFRNERTMPFDMRLKIPTLYKTYSFDLLNKNANIKSCLFDVVEKKTDIKSYIISNNLRDTFITSCNYDVVNASRLIKTLSQDILSQKALIKYATMRMNLSNIAENSCSFEMKLVDSHTDQIMNNFEKWGPQLPDVRYPNIPYKPVDYNTDMVVL